MNTSKKTLLGFVNEQNSKESKEINRIVDGFVDNIYRKKLISDKNTVAKIYDNDDFDNAVLSEIQIPLKNITVSNADEIVKFAKKYPAFQKNIANAFVDGDTHLFRLIFVKHL